MPVRNCTIVTTTSFLFDNVVTRFGFLKILISDQGTHTMNQLIDKLTEEFQIQQWKKTPYHPQENGVVEAFNKILGNALTKIVKFLLVISDLIKFSIIIA